MTARRAVTLAGLFVLAAGCAGGGSEDRDATREQAYSRLQDRPVSALSRRRVADLLAGRGAGYALAAELNHHPGPAHVLELADELALTDVQERRIRALESAVHDRARPLGRQLVGLERNLDRSFRSGTATPDHVAALTAAIARLDGRLRNVHLRAHLETRRLLKQGQVARYDRLRGYRPLHGQAGHDPAQHGDGDGDG